MRRKIGAQQPAAQGGVVSLRLRGTAIANTAIAKCNTNGTPAENPLEMSAWNTRVHMSVFGSCVEEGLVQQARSLVDELRRRQLTVVTAESCTGGLIAALLSHGTGASECLHGGYVVYTKEQKATALDVSRELLQRQGSVNAEVARQLAQGALGRSPADIALAVTGVLGPDADEDGNPPGLVWIAVKRAGQDPRVVEEHFNDCDPDGVRRATILRALTLLDESART